MKKGSSPNAATQVKQGWNASHYTQVKISADADLAAAFKAACASSGASMASVLTQYMAQYSKTATKRKPGSDYSTRRQRRAAVRHLLLQLELV